MTPNIADQAITASKIAPGAGSYKCEVWRFPVGARTDPPNSISPTSKVPYGFEIKI